MEGGAAMGLGYALLEEDRVVEGVTLTPNLMTYLIPTALDVPDVTTIVLESGEGMGPWGARGIGEPAMVPTAPAIANAVRDAVGVRLTRLPITPERLWRAMQDARALLTGRPASLARARLMAAPPPGRRRRRPRGTLAGGAPTRSCRSSSSTS